MTEGPIKVYTVTKNGKTAKVFINTETKIILTHELNNMGLTDKELDKVRERFIKLIIPRSG